MFVLRRHHLHLATLEVMNLVVLDDNSRKSWLGYLSVCMSIVIRGEIILGRCIAQFIRTNNF